MSVNKDFVVKNGLEVNRLLIRTNTTNNRVGINTDVINATLDVNGSLQAKGLSVTGVTTFTSINVTNNFQLSGSGGSSGQYLQSTGTGVTWANFPATRTTSLTTAILGQTLFPFSYTIGFIDVFVNGTKLGPTEFSAADGANVILSNPCVGGETVEFISYPVTSVGITSTLVVFNGITVQEEGSTVGVASGINYINFVGSAVTAVGTGAGVTVYISGSNGGGGTSSQFVTTAAGIHTLSNVGIGTTNPTSALTVSGNVNVTGVSTFAGITTVTGPTLFSKQLSVSGVSTLGNTIVGGATTQLVVNGDARITGILTIGTSSITLNGSSNVINVGTGVTIYGNSGIISATTFAGNFSGSITDATNLTGGTANASSLNVSGIATISQGRIQADASSNLRFGNLAAGAGSSRNIAIGDQVLASLSGGSGRNIGIGELSYYDTTTGQYNIGLGVQAGQKITTGSYNVIVGGYDGQTGLDLRTSSNNVVIADGQGNIRQYINSSGNVGIKTTVVTEALTVAGVVSATSFYGTLNASQLTGALPAINGSALIGVVGSGSGVIVQNNSTPVGTAGTINFGTGLNVSFASGIATVSSSIAGINTLGTSNFSQLSVSGVSTFTNTINLNAGNLNIADDGIIKVGSSDIFQIYRSGGEGQVIKSTSDLLLKQSRLLVNNAANTENMLIANQNGSVELYYDNSKKFETLGAGVTVTGTTFTNQLVSSGIVTASSFSGSGSGLTNLPSGQLTGALPAIDGSALLNVTAAGTGIGIRDDNTPVGSAVTVNFGTGLDVTFSSGIATVNASGGSLQSRTIVSGTTTSIANNGIGNTNITGFKSYALMKVGLSTAGWLRLYTDSASRANDASRSQGIDPSPGSGVIAEVITTGISTTQIISPFVMGGNLNNPADTTIYAAITNLSGSTQAITANLTILQLEA